jgi:hypothetical protein
MLNYYGHLNVSKSIINQRTCTTSCDVLMTLMIAGLFCVFLGVVGTAVLSAPREGGLARPMKQFCQRQDDCS